MNEDNQPRFGFVDFAETWNGRMAMMGILIGLGTELITGQGILRQIGITSIVVSLGFLKFFEFLLSKSAPQLEHELFIPKDIMPHWEQVFTFDLKEFIPIKEIRKINSGTKNISNNIFPKKLIKKFNPKIGITNRKIKE